MKNMTLGGYNLLLQVPTKTSSVKDEQNQRLLEDTEPFYTYGHFNTGYPFLGVDKAVGDIIEADLETFIPDLTCTYNTYSNPWDVCYYKTACDPSVFNGASMSFSFGGDSLFTMPLSAFMQEYDYGSSKYCAIMI